MKMLLPSHETGYFSAGDKLQVILSPHLAPFSEFLFSYFRSLQFEERENKWMRNSLSRSYLREQSNEWMAK